MNRLTPRALSLVLAATLVVAPLTAAAQIYRWIDADGDVHYSEGIDSVPLRHRRDAVVVSHERPSPATGPGQASTSALPPGAGRVTFTPGQPIIVTARLSGAGSARLILDARAARTSISPTALLELGVSYLVAQTVTIKGPAGDAKVLTVPIESLDVGGARYGPLMVVSEMPPFERQVAEGILGRDFLDHFTVTMDDAAGTVTLTPK